MHTQALRFHEGKGVHTDALTNYIKEKPHISMQFVQSRLLFAIVTAKLKLKLLWPTLIQCSFFSEKKKLMLAIVFTENLNFC